MILLTIYRKEQNLLILLNDKEKILKKRLILVVA